MSRNTETVLELWRLFGERRYRETMPLLHPGFSATWPVTREILPTPEAFIRVQEEYPGTGTITVDEIVDGGDVVVSFVTLEWANGNYTAISRWRFMPDGRIGSVTEWWPDEAEPGTERTHLVERY
jgi:hypothetical protein